MRLYIDIETDTAHQQIWCAAYAIDDAEPEVTVDKEQCKRIVEQADEIRIN